MEIMVIFIFILALLWLIYKIDKSNNSDFYENLFMVTSVAFISFLFITSFVDFFSDSKGQQEWYLK